MNLGFLNDPSSSGESNNTACDPRLSRAARELVRRQLKAILNPTNDSSLSQLLHIAGLRSGSCPLRAEENDLSVVAPAPSARSLFSLPFSKIGNRPRVSYACSLCGKTFTSRYYLDQHLQLTHREATGQVCEADWCRQFLSRQACHDVALELEPFYGRGSAQGPESSKIRHSLAREAHSRPCKEDDMLKVKGRCESTVASCFDSESVSRQLNQSLCQPLSCHHRLHRLVALLPRLGSIHEGTSLGYGWSSVWAETHARYYEVGLLGTAALIFLFIVYVRCGFEYFGRRPGFANGIIQPRRTSRLLAPKNYHRLTRKDKVQ